MSLNVMSLNLLVVFAHTTFEASLASGILLKHCLVRSISS